MRTVQCTYISSTQCRKIITVGTLWSGSVGNEPSSEKQSSDAVVTVIWDSVVLRSQEFQAVWKKQAFLWARIVMHYVPPCGSMLRLPTKVSSLDGHVTSTHHCHFTNSSEANCQMHGLCCLKVSISECILYCCWWRCLFLSFYYNWYLHDCLHKGTMCLFVTRWRKTKREFRQVKIKKPWKDTCETLILNAKLAAEYVLAGFSCRWSELNDCYSKFVNIEQT